MTDTKYGEILPPLHNQIAPRSTNPVTIPSPKFDSHDFITAFFDRLKMNRDTLGVDARTRKTAALVEWTQERTKLIESQTVHEAKLFGLLVQREVLVHNLQYERSERQERLRDQAHGHELAQMRRDTERNRTMVALVDAQQ